LAAEAVGGRSIFPLLVKLIDASENLSIQVHPDDQAAERLARVGKTEAWHVLAADPGSLLYLGVQPGVSFADFQAAAAKLDGTSAHLMRTIKAQAGMTVLIPAGTIHALGAGVMVYEIQQPSDVTFRLDDWGRTDADGIPRDVHHSEGFTVARPELLPELIAAVSLRPAIGERHLLAACRYFSLERLALPTGGSVDIGSDSSPAVVTILEGRATVSGMTLIAGESAVVWPSPTQVSVTAVTPLVALVAQVPDLLADVVEPARKAGADQESIVNLGGATGDISGVIRQ
jgi:mannose-6-phosphate isomerase